MMTTPTRFGIASKSRFAISPNTAEAVVFPGGDLGRAPQLRRSTFCQGAIVEPAMEPIRVAGHILLHRDVDVGLINRDARHVGVGLIDETLYILFVCRLVAIFGRCNGAVDESIGLLRLIAHRVEDRIFAVVAPDEEILGVVEPAREYVRVKRPYVLIKLRTPVRAAHFIDRALDSVLGQAFWREHADRFIDTGEAEVERDCRLEAVWITGFGHQGPGRLN